MILVPHNEDEVMVWRVEVTGDSERVHACLSMLTNEEKLRAERRRAGLVRNQFVIARGALRTLLGDALDIDPRTVSIVTDEFGKPDTPSVNGRRVFFNVAHSRSSVLIAMGYECPLGVDIEYIDQEKDLADIAESYFTANESSRISSTADPEQRARNFYRCWTQKEAVAKADGRGLSLSLGSFETPIDHAQNTPVKLGGEFGKTYYLSDLSLAEGVVGAVACESQDCRIRVLDLEWL